MNKIQTVNEAVRAIFEMPEFPEPIRKDVCLHCVIMNSGDAKGKEMLQKLTAILVDNGVDAKRFVSDIRTQGVTNVIFENEAISIPTGFGRFLLLEPSWHKVLSFDLFMEIVGQHF